MTKKTGRLTIKNYDTLQHYKDRCPPWIKLATDTFQDYEFGCLQDASKLLALCCWTLASRSEDRTIPADLRWIKNQCNLTDVTEENLKELIDQGFIICDSNVLADCYQNACLEAETEEETERDTPLNPPSPPNSTAVMSAARWSAPELINYFNQKCGTSHSSTDKKNIYYFQKTIDHIVAVKKCDIETAQNYVREIIDAKAWDMYTHPHTKAMLRTTFDLNRVNDVMGTLKNGKFVPPEQKPGNLYKNKTVETQIAICKTCNKNPLPKISGVCASECDDCAQKNPWCKCARNRTNKNSNICKQCNDDVAYSIAELKRFKNLAQDKINDIVKQSVDNAKNNMFQILGEEAARDRLKQEGITV